MKSFPDHDLNDIVEGFSVVSKKYSFSPLTDGFINDTFLVSDNDGPRYILQRINHSVFKNIAGVMNNIKHALTYLDAPDYRKISLVDTLAGKPYLELEEKGSDYWRMMTYITDSTAHNTTTEPNIAFEAGRIIGAFHGLLREAQPENYVDTIPRFHDLTLRKDQFKEALESIGFNKKTKKPDTRTENANSQIKATEPKTDNSVQNDDKLQIAASAIKFAQQTLNTLEKIDFSQLPVRICHNDTKLNNILFSKQTGKALCLIDLDTLMKGYFLYDFGDAIRTIANTAPEDEQDHSKITFEKPLFEAFLNGLAIHKSIFTEREIQTMAWGAIVMPFLHGIRALTDYLNGNIYYKVAYENQNLDRCLSLFDFTSKALNEMEYIKRMVSKKLS